jgi:hypothetical protein
MAAAAARRKQRKLRCLQVAECLSAIPICTALAIALWWLLGDVLWPLLQAFWGLGNLLVQGVVGLGKRGPELLRVGGDLGRGVGWVWQSFPRLLQVFIVALWLAIGMIRLTQRVDNWVKQDDGKPH